MTEVLQKQSAIYLFRELPTIKYDIVFISNRILKGITSIEDKIIKRCSTSDYPTESFVIIFQNMGNSHRCNALVYIRGKGYKNTYNDHYFSRTQGRALVGYCGWQSKPEDPRYTDIGQLTLADVSELDQFTKVVRWTYDFLQLYREEKGETKDAS